MYALTEVRLRVNTQAAMDEIEEFVYEEGLDMDVTYIKTWRGRKVDLVVVDPEGRNQTAIKTLAEWAGLI